MDRLIIIRDGQGITIDLAEDYTPEMWAAIPRLADMAFSQATHVEATSCR